MITAMKLSRESETRGNVYGGFQKGAGSPSGTSRGRPRRRSSLKPRTGGLDGRRSRRQSHRVSFANSIEVKEFGNSSNENTPTQGNLPTPAATLQVSTPIEDKLKRPRLVEEKSGISRLSIIPKCDTNFIDDSDDFEPYVDSSPNQNVFNTRASNRIPSQQDPPQQNVPRLSRPEHRVAPVSPLAKNELSATKPPGSLADVSMIVREEEVESEGKDVSATRYNNSDMELTLEDASRVGELEDVPAREVSVTRYNNSDMELTNVAESSGLPLAKDNHSLSVQSGAVNPAATESTVVEEQAIGNDSVRDVTVTHYNNSDMDLTDIAEKKSLHQTEAEHPLSILADSVNPPATVLASGDVQAREKSSVEDVPVTQYNDSDMELTMEEELLQATAEDGGALASLQTEDKLFAAPNASLVSTLSKEDEVGKEPVRELPVSHSNYNGSDMEVTMVEPAPKVSGTQYNNIEVDFTALKDKLVKTVPLNRNQLEDVLKDSSVTHLSNGETNFTVYCIDGVKLPEMKEEYRPSVPESSVNPPVPESTSLEDTITVTPYSDRLRRNVRNKSMSRAKDESPQSSPARSVNPPARASTSMDVQMSEISSVEDAMDSHFDNSNMEVTLPQNSQTPEVELSEELSEDLTTSTKHKATVVPMSTTGVFEKQPQLPSQSLATNEGPRKVDTATPPSSQPHFSKTSIPNEIAELERLPGVQKSQPNMALLKKKRKSPRLVHVPRTMVTRSNATGTPGNETFFNHVEYLRSRFLSIASSCFERLKNPTYVMGHPDFKEFLEVVINRANMGQSLLTLLIEYGRIARLSGDVSQVPFVSEAINENGPLESFEWIKKMIFEVQQKWPDVEAALVPAADLYHWQVDLWSSSKIQVTIHNCAKLTFIIDAGHLHSFPQRIVDIKVSYGRGSLMSSVPPVKSYSFTSEIAQLIWTVMIMQKQ